MKGNKLLGAVLCGGKSSRMGQDKALLTHPDGGTFLQHAVERIESICDTACIAGAPHQRPTLGTARFLPDKVAYAGPVSGVISALQFAVDRSFDGCLVTPIDMPYLSAADLSKIVTAYAQDKQLICAICQSDQRLQPLVAVYPVSLLDDLKSLAVRDDRSLSRWVQTQSHQTVPLSDQASRNVNKPGDAP